ncbi:MAPEG family protein [Shewanella sp. Isolate11]|uniref:MAPEG family protein n=1 Tax=Shewanella sp. Isolate11 TaxID=2908530 RepID=UPI001EFEDE0F|nr:MAPEG family protein [Shewanella sp. Isolate11]MCG9697608.1 MAPEG family protein [Shewanella sp. Isolate11]
MTTLLTCLLIAILLPYLAKGPVAVAMAKLGGYDNHHPRSQQAQLTGFGARAMAGHQNGFESLLIFAIAVLTVMALDKVNDMVTSLAVVYVVSRVIYHILYLLDKSSLRSLVWFVGFFSVLGIFCQAY